MTYPDDWRYPQPQRPQPPTGPYVHETRPPYAHETHRPYAQQTHRRDAELPDLAALRSAYRVLRRVSTLTALGSFVVYVVLSCFATSLMGAGIAGELSLGMALGILQLVVTFAAVFSYGRSARRSVDPLARAVRERAAGRPSGVAR